MAPEALALETAVANQPDDQSGSKAGEPPTHPPPPLRFADLPLTVKVARTRGQTLRDIYMESILRRFPNFKPRDDIDIIVLGPEHGGYEGPADSDGIYAWIDKELAQLIGPSGEKQWLLQSASASLRGVVEVTGTKPKPGEACANVFVCPIPNCDYSIRLFPGDFAQQTYCLDFVKSDTREPVNSPFEFELWAVPGPTGMGMVDPMRLRSLESAFGVRPEDIKPGVEKFVLRDGMTCLLKRPGHRTVRFVVPIRVKEGADASN